MAEHPYLADALDLLEEGVVALNMSLTPVAANRAGRAFLGFPGDGLPPNLPSSELNALARRTFVERRQFEDLVHTAHSDRYLRVRSVPLDDAEGVLFFLRDVTDEHRTHQLRRQFVMNASHELQTPVASLQVLAEAITDAVTSDPDAAARFGQRLAEETARLSAMIKDLLDLSRVEDPGALLVGRVDLSRLVRTQVDAATQNAVDKRIQLDAHIEAGIEARGDASQLELMVRNLISNALRYTPAEGHIQIRLDTQDAEVVLQVSDDGIGIPLHAQARVFERFYRLDDDRGRAGGGTGLGLSIVKNAAESHGGAVTVTSALGEGSTFTVRLPTSR